MMSIGEFARAVELSVSAVRFYADRGLLVPAHTDPSSGYRFYTDNQIERAALIRDLRLIDISLSDIDAMLEMEPLRRDQLIQQHLEGLEGRLSEIRSVAQNLESGIRDEGPTRLLSPDLAQAIQQVLVAAGTSPTEPHHMCVLIEVKDSSMRCVATDRHRLAVRDVVPTSCGSPFVAVVAAAEIASWPGALAAGDEVDVGVVDGALSIVGGDINLSAAVLPIAFPDYESVLQSTSDVAAVAVVDVSRFLELLALFEGTEPVQLSTRPDELMVTLGGARHRVTAQIAGVEGAVSINPVLASQLVEQAIGPELVIEIIDDLEPLTFRSADDGTYVAKLMPVKTA